MLNKLLCFLVAFLILSACSHQSKKQTASSAKRNSKFPLSIFQNHNYGKSEVNDRSPSSIYSIPGVPEFISALKKAKKANYAFTKMEVPVGYEVTTENSDGQGSKDLEKTIYLKQGKNGFFSLNSGDDGPSSLELNESFSPSKDIKEIIKGIKIYKEIKRVSESEFIFIKKNDKAVCETKIDLKKSFWLNIGETCKDPSGKLISSYNVISIKPIKIADYKEKLKSITLNIIPSELGDICDELGKFDETGTYSQDCFIDVVDREERDWSYILK